MIWLLKKKYNCTRFQGFNMERSYVSNAIRVACDLNAGKVEWQMFVD
ncbi:MAG: hypothetical protein ACYCWE_19305 [Eubacteriales bacterium]